MIHAPSADDYATWAPKTLVPPDAFVIEEPEGTTIVRISDVVGLVAYLGSRGRLLLSSGKEIEVDHLIGDRLRVWLDRLNWTLPFRPAQLDKR